MLREQTWCQLPPSNSNSKPQKVKVLKIRSPKESSMFKMFCPHVTVTQSLNSLPQEPVKKTTLQLLNFICADWPWNGYKNSYETVLTAIFSITSHENGTSNTNRLILLILILLNHHY